MNQKRINIESEIVLYLLRKESYGREISNDINIPLSSVQRKLNELENHGALVSKIQGKNKIYTIGKNMVARKFVFDAESYKMIKLIEKYPFMEPLIEDISKKCNSRLIILFGSYAKFISKPDSDIDIFVETYNRKIRSMIQEINTKLSVKIGNFDKNALLGKEIIKNHVIIRGAEYYYEKIGFFE